MTWEAYVKQLDGNLAQIQSKINELKSMISERKRKSGRPRSNWRKPLSGRSSSMRP